MSLAGAVSGAVAQTHVVKDDREAWLQSAWAGVRALYAAQGITLPDARLSVGVPPTAARARKLATADAIPVAIWGSAKTGYEIHVNPKHLVSAQAAIGALLHGAYIIGGKTLAQSPRVLIGSLGAPPSSIADSQHAPAGSLSAISGNTKDGTRQLKAHCRACRFVCRMSRKQANRGLPICGVCYQLGAPITRLELV